MPILNSFLTFESEWLVFIYRWGYIGIFLVNLLEAVTLTFFPLPTMVFVFSFGKILNPFLVGLSAGLGGTLGSIIGYILGRGFKDIFEKKHEKKMNKIKKYIEKKNMFLAIIFLGFTPISYNLLPIFCGTIEYDIKKYLLAIFISRLLLNLFLAYAGYYSITWISGIIDSSII
ncbi:MAG: VTT domain-containing protein [Candidatus Aenigmatarchaeota archaeon]